MARVLTRRLTALTAATALVSGAGLVSGALVGVANAIANPLTVSPSAVSNAGSAPTMLTIAGSGFVPPTNKVTVVPDNLVGKPEEMKAIDATVDQAKSTPTQLVITVPLQYAAPVAYDVTVADTAVPGSMSGTCDKCLAVTNPGRPTVLAVTSDGGGGFITITGTNFAIGATVSFLKSDGTADGQMTFDPGRDNSDGTHTSGYVGSTTIKGKASDLGSATAGKHILKVTNQDNQVNTESVEFWQPKLTGVTPATLGQGASGIPVTATGAGIRSGSAMAVSQFVTSGPTGDTTTIDITVGTATVSTGNDSVTAPVSVSTAGGPSARTVSVTGPDGGFASTGGLAITAFPNPSGGFAKSAFGQGAKDEPTTITGTDFKPGITFSVGDGVTITTQSVTGSTSASVNVTVAPDALVGGRDTLTATNPDHGTGTKTGDGTPVVSPFPFTVNPGPVVTSIAPGGLQPNQSKTVTLTGTGFDPNGMTVTSTGGLTFTNVVVASNGNSATATATAAPGAAAGSRDVTVTNTADRGSYTCAACMGIDSLSITPAAGANSNPALDIDVTASSGSLTGASFVLHKSGPTIQPDIPGTSPVIAAGGGSGRVTFDLRLAAPGLYNLVATTPGGVLSCTGCFAVTGSPFTLGATPITPATGGQGATDFPITLHGTNFVHGQRISIAGTTVSETTFVSTTTMTATISIPYETATGAKDVVVTHADGSNAVTGTGKYTVVAAPTVTGASTEAADHKSIGQGANNEAVAITGTGFTAGKVEISGTGLTVSTTPVGATLLKATVTVASNAPTTARDVTVTNTDNGGTSKPLDDAIVITPKPVVSIVAPRSLLAGQVFDQFKITGQNFQAGSVPVIANVQFSNITISSDGTTITAKATVATAAPAGARTVTVNNSDGGSGSLANGFTVVVPTALTHVLQATSTAGTIISSSGRLTNKNTGAGIAGVKVTFTLTPQVGSGGTAPVVTNSTGNWSFRFKPYYTTKATVSYPGDASHLASAAVTRSVGVSTKVTVTSPPHGARSAAASVLYVTGTTSPNKAGKPAYLYRRLSNGRLQALTLTTIASNGTYRLAIRLGKGAYTLVVSVPAATGNTTGRSVYFTHFRI